jgi:hypothetical protein
LEGADPVAQHGRRIVLAHQVQKRRLVATVRGRGRHQRSAERQGRQVDALGVRGDDQNPHGRLRVSMSRV